MATEGERRLIDKVRRDMGPIVTAALDDPQTVEVMLNADGAIWHERLGEMAQRIGSLESAKAEAVIRGLASFVGEEVTERSPILEAELPLDGGRFAGVIPPVATAPMFSIRKPISTLLTLADYVSQGVLTSTQLELLTSTVRQHRNILVVGGTGSGKTTLVNALIAEAVAQRPTERIVILEDTLELRCTADNSVRLRANRHVSMTDLLRTTLRLRPDRILVGEVRGPEALDLLMAWNTGHEGGIATCHANDAAAGLLRLEMMISMNRQAPAKMAALIADAVDVVVHITRDDGGGRSVRQILEVDGHSEADGYRTSQTQEDRP